MSLPLLNMKRPLQHFRGVHNIRHYIPASAVRYPSAAVKAFCDVPIDHYFTTKAIPGFRNDFFFTQVLKDEYNIKNPLDLVIYLRSETKGYPRLGVHVMASVLADFFSDVADRSGVREREKSQVTASICIAIMEEKLRRGTSKLSFTSLPPCN